MPGFTSISETTKKAAEHDIKIIKEDILRRARQLVDVAIQIQGDPKQIYWVRVGGDYNLSVDTTDPKRGEIRYGSSECTIYPDSDRNNCFDDALKQDNLSLHQIQKYLINALPKLQRLVAKTEKKNRKGMKKALANATQPLLFVMSPFRQTLNSIMSAVFILLVTVSTLHLLWNLVAKRVVERIVETFVTG